MSTLILFNKPYNVLSQFSGDIHEETLAAYINMPGFYAAGRLDKNSEGLLLLTDNGALQHKLAHPSNNKKKHYWVQVEGHPHDNDLLPLRRGLQLKDYRCLPAEAQIIAEPAIWPRNPPIRTRVAIPTTWLELIISEGKNHQIRKMTAAIGFPTLRLIRHRIDAWSVEEIAVGDYRLIKIK